MTVMIWWWRWQLWLSLFDETCWAFFFGVDDDIVWVDCLRWWYWWLLRWWHYRYFCRWWIQSCRERLQRGRTCRVQQRWQSSQSPWRGSLQVSSCHDQDHLYDDDGDGDEGDNACFEDECWHWRVPPGSLVQLGLHWLVRQPSIVTESNGTQGCTKKHCHNHTITRSL